MERVDEKEERLLLMLEKTGGKEKVAAAIENVIYMSVPKFILDIKGKASLYTEVRNASLVIVYEEVAKGDYDLYNRISSRVNNYWRDSMS